MSEYLSGFRNYFETEALPGTLPIGQNSPQTVAHGLYAEQLSGTSFTMARTQNLRSWLYRIRPSVLDGRFTPFDLPLWKSAGEPSLRLDPNQMRWNPPEHTNSQTDFLRGLHTYVVSGSVAGRTGSAAHIYTCNQSMGNTFFYSADSELLILPQEGALQLHTEFGFLEVSPLEIVLIPRGVKFKVDLAAPKARGYVLENYGSPFTIPDLGPIGANGSALPRDFLYPVAKFNDENQKCVLIQKFQGQFWSAELSHHPLDVVAWHGNYAPCKYDLRKFMAVGAVTFDHPDPSIWTVLTSPSATPGLANADFVIFPPRWMVAEHTFRPPYFHRNIMSEFMGLIEGFHDSKAEGFLPGGASLHNCMAPHGPDLKTFDAASSIDLKPQYLKDTMAFMLEGQYPYAVTETAYTSPLRQKNYQDCWSDLSSHFKK